MFLRTAWVYLQLWSKMSSQTLTSYCICVQLFKEISSRLQNIFQMFIFNREFYIHFWKYLFLWWKFKHCLRNGFSKFNIRAQHSRAMIKDLIRTFEWYVYIYITSFYCVTSKRSLLKIISLKFIFLFFSDLAFQNNVINVK